MRDILFRAKRKNWKTEPNENHWVFGVPMIVENKYMMLLNDNDNLLRTHYTADEMWCAEIYAVEIDIDTLCQYTGSTDDKDHKIWENDIVVYSWTNGQEEETENTTVTYDKYGFTPFIWEYDCDGCCLYDEITGIQVIGNIFDNPDL